MRTVLHFVIGTSLALYGTQAVHARGFGGFHAGGFGGGGFGGLRAGGFEGGGFRAGGFEGGGARTGGFEAGGFRAGGGAGFGGYNVGGFQTGGIRAGGFGAGGYRAGGLAGYGAGHIGLPTDGGLARGWSGAGFAGYGAIGHNTVAWSNSVAVARGVGVRTAFSNYGVFGPGWHNAHPGAWAAAGWAAGSAWNVATWPALAAWYGWGTDVQPVNYVYGGNITYQGDEVYYGTQPVATADQYYQQAATLAQSAPAAAPDSNDWMPLGVFSLVQGDQTDSNTMFQLAINKSGALAGNYYNALTETALPIHGSVDKKTQRIAWTVGDNKIIVYDAGLTSLTADEAPVLLHFGKDRTQQWMLVRLKKSAQQKPQQ